MNFTAGLGALELLTNPSALNHPRVVMAQNLLYGELGAQESLTEYLTASGTNPPRVLSLLLNRHCNLHCSHCYLDLQAQSGNDLALDQLDVLLSNAAGRIPKLALSGKEIFFSRETRSLLEGLIRRGTFSAFRRDIITNGLLMDSEARELAKAYDPASFQISIDGLRDTHDSVRGVGCFDKTLPAIQWAVNEFGGKTGLAITLNVQNLSELPDLVEFFSGCGVQMISCSLYYALPYTNTALALTEKHIQNFFAGLEALKRIRVPQKTFLSIDVQSYHPDALFAFIGSRYFDLDALMSTADGELFFVEQLNERLDLVFRFIPWPYTYKEVIRINPDGGVLPGDHVLASHQYENTVVTGILDHDLDPILAVGSQAARNASKEILNHFFEDAYPSLRTAVSLNTGM